MAAAAAAAETRELGEGVLRTARNYLDGAYCGGAVRAYAVARGPDVLLVDFDGPVVPLHEGAEGSRVLAACWAAPRGAGPALLAVVAAASEKPRAPSTVHVYAVGMGRELVSRTDFDGPLLGAAWQPAPAGDAALAVLARDRAVVYEVAPGRPARGVASAAPGGGRAIEALAWAPGGGRRLLLAASGGELLERQWDEAWEPAGGRSLLHGAGVLRTLHAGSASWWVGTTDAPLALADPLRAPPAAALPAKKRAAVAATDDGDRGEDEAARRVLQLLQATGEVAPAGAEKEEEDDDDDDDGGVIDLTSVGMGTPGGVLGSLFNVSAPESPPARLAAVAGAVAAPAPHAAAAAASPAMASVCVLQAPGAGTMAAHASVRCRRLHASSLSAFDPRSGVLALASYAQADVELYRVDGATGRVSFAGAFALPGQGRARGMALRRSPRGGGLPALDLLVGPRARGTVVMASLYPRCSLRLASYDLEGLLGDGGPAGAAPGATPAPAPAAAPAPAGDTDRVLAAIAALGERLEARLDGLDRAVGGLAGRLERVERKMNL